jgi:hypothetical protein
MISRFCAGPNPRFMKTSSRGEERSSFDYSSEQDADGLAEGKAGTKRACEIFHKFVLPLPWSAAFFTLNPGNWHHCISFIHAASPRRARSEDG